ncbi:hypothetical protein BpHYR1_048536 [Brachionus plicatilis]|uniref:Uncharacterized protein n=1 Tax=Brachionus plicatilis TaxID=10195 RepID=A0A3M7QL26_BRAPC|nr:hypothetical protein BpHYR1_048536 [Brachionus plicatilis]
MHKPSFCLNIFLDITGMGYRKLGFFGDITGSVQKSFINVSTLTLGYIRELIQAIKIEKKKHFFEQKNSIVKSKPLGRHFPHDQFVSNSLWIHGGAPLPFAGLLYFSLIRSLSVEYGMLKRTELQFRQWLFKIHTIYCNK